MKYGLKPRSVFRLIFGRTAGLCKTVFKGRSLRHLAGERKLALPLFACLAAAAVAVLFLNLKIVKIVDGKGAQFAYTLRSNPVSILKQCGISLSKADEYHFSGFKNNYGVINLYEAFPVNVSADKAEKNVLVARGTVADVLKKAHVSLGQDDIVSVPLDSTVTKDTQVIVNRIRYETVTQSKPIDFKVVTRTSTQFKKGTQKVETEGKQGEESITLRLKYVDDSLTDQQVVSDTVVSQPVDQEVVVGTAADTPASAVTSNSQTLSDQGIPVQYRRVISAVATGYTASAGSSTATGRKAGVGYVAVNPNVIPYGTRLYIMTADGSYVYGYAVAADTGGFVHNGSGVDLDLYFSSDSQCQWFGRRNVKVYILS